MAVNSELRTFDLEDYEIGRLLGRGAFSCVRVLKRRRNQKLCDFDSSCNVDNTSSSSPDFTNSSDSASTSSSHDEEAEDHHDQVVSESLVSLPPPSTSKSSEAAAAARVVNARILVSESLSPSPSKSSEVATAVVNTKILAAKRLRSKTLHNGKIAKKAAQDLRNEAVILSSFPSHPHIVRFLGVSSGFWANDPNACLVLEKLRGTLHDALKEWRSAAFSNSAGTFFNLFERNKWLTKKAQRERIELVGVGIASALSFLHRRNIIFRDLKPSNIGFDKEGNVRLFDFASSRSLEHRDQKLKSRSGTLRYMAPEVARRESYDLAADAYSFGVLLVEVVTLEKPYEKTEATKAQLNEWVKKPNKHPSVKHVKSSPIKQLLVQCWSDDATKRPTLKKCWKCLTKEVNL